MAQSSTSHSATPPLTPQNLTIPGIGSQTPASHDQHQFIWMLTGPAGCGKSTLGEYLASTLGLPYIEGDEFHTKANVEKMAKGIPLTDADRWDWLVSLRKASVDRLEAGHRGVVLTCSALKRKYRDEIRIAPYYSHNILVHIFYLDAQEDVLQARVQARKGHYMGANMVRSQFTILEPPEKDETDVSRVDVSRPLGQIQCELLSIIANINKELERKTKS